MYRDDREALSHKIEVLDREHDALVRQNEAMRQHIVAMQYGRPVAPVPLGVYHVDVRYLAPAHRAVLAHHRLRPFPVWTIALLNVVTLGLYPLIHFGMLHDQLPRAAHDDPSSGRAIGFSFIPYLNLYWLFWHPLRLCDRLDLQFRLRGMRQRAPRGLLLACSIFTLIPFVNLIFGIPVLWTIGVSMLQATVNEVAALDPLVDGAPPPNAPRLP